MATVQGRNVYLQIGDDPPVVISNLGVEPIEGEITISGDELLAAIEQGRVKITGVGILGAWFAVGDREWLQTMAESKAAREWTASLRAKQRRLRRASGYLPGSLILTILDTKTGETRSTEGPHFDEFDAHWWVEGNGSCDCNRACLFEHWPQSNTCLGSKRYLIVGAEGEMCGYALKDFNEEYPVALIKEYLDLDWQKKRRKWRENDGIFETPG